MCIAGAAESIAEVESAGEVEEPAASFILQKSDLCFSSKETLRLLCWKSRCRCESVFN